MRKSLAYKVIIRFIAYIKCIGKYTLYHGFLIADIIKAHYLEKKLGIETDGFDYYSDNLSLYKDGHAYGASLYCNLDKVFEYLKPKPEDIFLDLGCGKGRVVFFAALRKINKVTGVDVNQELIEVANLNLANFKPNNASIEFINEDAANFKIRGETIIFMFNPFGSMTLKKVITNIKNSLSDNPRKISIVFGSLFGSPSYENLLYNEDWLVLEAKLANGEYSVWGNRV